MDEVLHRRQVGVEDRPRPAVEDNGICGDVGEVFNYVSAVEHVLDPDRRLPVSLPLLREAHCILLTGVRGGYASPGELRTSPNWIGPPGCALTDATYVPPAPERLWERLDPFEKYLHADTDLPPLLSIACLHYQFEAIHPFLDGNGRVGRLLVILLMAEWGLLPDPLLDLSAYIEPRRDEYYARLLAVSTEGDWNGWVSCSTSTSWWTPVCWSSWGIGPATRSSWPPVCSMLSRVAHNARMVAEGARGWAVTDVSSAELIGVALPLDTINRESAREKSVPRKEHPATMHLWWARHAVQLE